MNSKTAPKPTDKWSVLKGTFAAWFVFGLSLGATALAAYLSNLAAVRQAAQRFESETAAVTADLTERLRAYEQVLLGGVSAFYSWPSVTRENWRRYVEHLQISEHYPGIQGIGFAEVVPRGERQSHEQRVRSEGFPGYRIWPEGDRDFYTSIVYLEPFDWRNQRAFGYDMFQNPVRRAAMERARDTGRASLSGKVRLVQETDEAVQAGFLMYLPVYESPGPEDAEARRRQLRGYVYSPFRMSDFMRGLPGDREHRVALQVFDGDAVSDGALMVSTVPPDRFDRAGTAMTRTEPIELMGRTWTLRFAALPPLDPETDKPAIIAAAGFIVSFLLWAIVWSLARNRMVVAAAHERLQGDIVRRERVEAQLRDAEAGFRYLFEKNPNPMWVFDRQTLVILEVNDAAVAHYGYAHEEFRRMKISELRPAEDVRRLTDYLQDRPLGFAESGEWRHVTKDGRTLDVEIVSHHLEFRQRPATLVVARDVTETKRAEAQLRQAQKMEAVGQLTGGIAHDFNNLLTVIVGNLELAASGTSGPQAEAIAEALSAAEKGASLTHRLLAYARKQTLQPEFTDVNRTVTGMIDLLRRTLGEDVEIEVQLDENLWPELADKSQLENALLNLAINSRDAMPDGGKLTIETANASLDEEYAARNAEVEPGDYVMLAVTDTGTGMAPEVVERVFEPFFTTKETGTGSGLGLSMIYGFARQSGGHLKVYSEIGHGTTVRLYLPRAGRTHSEAPARSAAVEETRGHETILVVEDEDAVRRLVVRNLRNLGYRVLEAADGRQATTILDGDDSIDLLFTDVVLSGGVTGRELAERARRLRPEIRVLFTSGYTQNSIVHQGKLDEGVQLLSKPYRRQDLARKVREVLRSAAE